MASIVSSLALSPAPTKLRSPPPSLGILSSFAISACRSFQPSPGARISRRTLSIRALTLDFSGSFFEGGGDEEGGGPSASSAAAAVHLGDKEEPQCPPGLRRVLKTESYRSVRVENVGPLADWYADRPLPLV
ncbi:hypothetical protein GW17_00043943 [Ensete ventricosum]|nr:hypothetical protein GW17_00043943 [Ensete ventricosum]